MSCGWLAPPLSQPIGAAARRHLLYCSAWFTLCRYREQPQVCTTAATRSVHPAACEGEKENGSLGCSDSNHLSPFKWPRPTLACAGVACMRAAPGFNPAANRVTLMDSCECKNAIACALCRAGTVTLFITHMTGSFCADSRVPPNRVLLTRSWTCRGVYLTCVLVSSLPTTLAVSR